MKRTTIACLSIILAVTAFSQNPIVPPGMYIADPEAHVWEDGKIYIYGSRDESDEYWCSYSHHVLSSTDLLHWDIDENSISSQGENDQIDYHDRLLFAPDCAYKNGTYYLYYCSPKTLTEGVATSTSPYGPFTKGMEIIGPNQIDPAVLVDDDGKAYYWWGQANAKVAKLKPNMKEVELSTMTMPLDKAGAKAFHEGSSIRKIGDKYYLVFADDSRDNRPTCLGYAISDHPMGPFTYKGVIIDNKDCDPSSWNNHGSIEEFKGKWYVFYHRSTNNSRKFRKACIEPIKINKDGSIDEVLMTSQVAGPALNAKDRIQAERACGLSGNVRIATLPFLDIPQEGLTTIMDGDKAVFRYIDFGKGVNHIEIKTLNSNGGSMEIRLDSPDGKTVGSCLIEPTAKNTGYQISKFKMDKIKGTQEVWLVFNGQDNQLLFDVDWFRFY